MSEDRKPIERLFADDYPFQTESVCLSEDVRELESLLQSKEALLDKAVEMLELIMRYPYTNNTRKITEDLLREIKEKPNE